MNFVCPVNNHLLFHQNSPEWKKWSQHRHLLETQVATDLSCLQGRVRVTKHWWKSLILNCDSRQAAAIAELLLWSACCVSPYQHFWMSSAIRIFSFFSETERAFSIFWRLLNLPTKCQYLRRAHVHFSRCARSTTLVQFLDFARMFDRYHRLQSQNLYIGHCTYRENIYYINNVLKSLGRYEYSIRVSTCFKYTMYSSEWFEYLVQIVQYLPIAVGRRLQWSSVWPVLNLYTLFHMYFYASVLSYMCVYTCAIL